jgi:hypothetical protein
MEVNRRIRNRTDPYEQLLHGFGAGSQEQGLIKFGGKIERAHLVPLEVFTGKAVAIFIQSAIMLRISNGL